MSERFAWSPRPLSFLLTSFLFVGLGLSAEGCGNDEILPFGEVSCNPGYVLCNGICTDPASGPCTPAGSGGTDAVVDDGLGSGGGSSGGGPNSTSSGGANGAGGGNGSGGTASTCSNDAPPPPADWPDATCEKWANETAECDATWMVEANYCNESCGRCTENTSGGSGGSESQGAGGGAAMGEGNPWGQVNGGQTGWASRYWDCCKQSCGWNGKGGNSPVANCDASGSNEVDANQASACDAGGSSTTCNSYTPWAYSSEVSFAFVATHAGSNVTCGTCYHIEFTGSSHNGGADPGSAALAGKTMIVMSTNIGGDVSGDGQMDMLVPGGGTGALYGCNVAWGVEKGDQKLGATYGGLRSGCSGGLDQIKSCVKSKCDSLFGNLPDMKEGCYWYVDWFQAADNPNFKVETISCPAELTAVAK